MEQFHTVNSNVNYLNSCERELIEKIILRERINPRWKPVGELLYYLFRENTDESILLAQKIQRAMSSESHFTDSMFIAPCLLELFNVTFTK